MLWERSILSSDGLPLYNVTAQVSLTVFGLSPTCLSFRNHVTGQVSIAYNQQMVAVLLLVLVLVLSPIIILLVRKIALTMQVRSPTSGGSPTDGASV